MVGAARHRHGRPPSDIRRRNPEPSLPAHRARVAAGAEQCSLPSGPKPAAGADPQAFSG
jgi:hypothetical protein